MGRLEGKSVLITGGGSGIGRASARRFVAEGARVAVVDLDPDRARTSAQDATGATGATGGTTTAIALTADVTDEDQLRAAAAATVDAFGSLTTLVNCAGGSIAEDAPVTEVDLSVWDHTMSLDLKGTFLACRVAIPLLQAAGGGTIVNFTSVVALQGNFRGHVYTAAKGGVISLTQTLAGRYWRDGIRVNAIAPGVVLSDRVQGRMGLDDSMPVDQRLARAQELNRRLIDDRHPFGFGVPDDIANVALFLASDESRMVNGAVIPAEGGASAY